MALEDLTGSSKFITSLVPANPLSSDDRREGDDHIRGVKNVLRNTFPGLNSAVNLTNSSGPFLPLAGGVVSGDVTLYKASGATALYFNAVAGSCLLEAQRNGIKRWQVYLGNTASETGGNAGSDFLLERFADNGSSLGGGCFCRGRMGG